MNDTEMLSDVRRQCRAAKDEYRKLRTEFQSKEAETQRIEIEIGNYDGLITAHVEAKPTDFPTDEELAAWQKRRDKLMGARQKLVDKRRESLVARDAARLLAIRKGSQLESLMWSERGLRNKIDGEPEGGISFVA